jgi:predicted transcriptional regulator
MPQLPPYRPKKMSLGSLEQEILDIVWQLGKVTVKDVHDRILADPHRELAYTSVTTVLSRLTTKGWLMCQKQDKKGRAFQWEARVSRQQALALQAYEHLHNFLAVGNADIVASFADRLDLASVEQIEAIAAKLKAVRQQKEERS